MKTRFVKWMAAVLFPASIVLLPAPSLATDNTIGQLDCSEGDVALFDGFIWVCSGQFDDVTANLEALEEALSDESAARDDADALLEEALSDEEAARIQADENEAAARGAADADIQSQVDALAGGAPAGQFCLDGTAVAGFDADANIICTEGIPPDPGALCPCFSLEEIDALPFSPSPEMTCIDIDGATEIVEDMTEIDAGLALPFPPTDQAGAAVYAGSHSLVSNAYYSCWFQVVDSGISISIEGLSEEQIGACRAIVRASDWWIDNCPTGAP